MAPPSPVTATTSSSTTLSPTPSSRCCTTTFPLLPLRVGFLGWEGHLLWNNNSKTIIEQPLWKWIFDLWKGHFEIVLKHFIPECVNHAGFDDVKKNLLIKKRKTVNHAFFDDAEKKSLDNDCHHQNGEECECINTWFWWCKKRIKQGCFKG